MFEKSNTLIIGSDHAGFELKEFLKNQLIDMGFIIKDYGTYNSTSMDYPDVAHPLARAINNNEFFIGILICGSGNGMCITANKYEHVRASLCWNTEIARLARAHNDANILCLPARFVDEKEALTMTLTFLHTDFEGGRHKIRVDKI